MFTNYLKIAWRNLVKQKVFSFINVFGLTAGLTCFLLVALYIVNELTYDAFHKNADTIYRVIETKTSAQNKETKVVSIPFNVSEKSKKEFPEVQAATRFSMLGRSNIYNNDNTNTFYESYFLADEPFLKIFDFPIVQGDRNTALSEPYSVVINEETAIKIFGEKNVVGKTLRTDRDSIPYKITAVINIPDNSHLTFNLLFSEATLYSSQNFMNFASNDWSSNTFVTYLHLKKGGDEKQTATKINGAVRANRKEAEGVKSNFYLQPLKDIHFYSAGIEGAIGKEGNIMHIYVFGIIAIFVLLIACINYMNLTTARFAGRSKEIAVRKVAGAAQKNLIAQFLSEALLVTVIALIFALLAVKIILPYFNSFTEKSLSLGFATDYRIWIGILLVAIMVGLLSGVYPAFFQSKLKPYLLLKNKMAAGKGALSIRKALVVFQFSLSIIMIIATIIVYQQLKYVSTKDMGFNKEQLVVVDINSGTVRRSAETIKSEFSKLSAVKSVSVSSRVPGEWKVIPKVKVKSGGKMTTAGEDIYFMAIDNQFLKTFEVKLLNGRNFSDNNLADSSAVLLNEAAAKMLGITQPSEQLVQIPSVGFSGNITELEQPFSARVIGIVKDFNFQSLREEVAPMILANPKNPVHPIDYFTARVDTRNVPALLKGMEGVLTKIDAAHLFEYNFLDKQWELFYREDTRRQVVFLSVALMTIIIACLGLFGLATYAAQQRIKEIGIRKVLGASVSSIVTMLSKDFLKLVLIAAIIAFPVAGWAMHNWLQDFAYRISINWAVYAVAGSVALLIALFTTSFQALKAALVNPVKSLRSE
ncbi:MAG TPA: FtsX-like permease family protein [Chitinophagaceae bacterium]|nr:FtsX-like permease family protein [Chitinophagaceae bacterium]